jgi:hypothetical protein
MRTHAIIASLAALALTGCALAPEFKTFYLSGADWRDAALSSRGRQTVADAVDGAAPLTVTILEIGALAGLEYDPERRLRIQDERARSLAAALTRIGVAPADIGLEAVAADGSEREPPPLLARRMVIVAHY